MASLAGMAATGRSLPMRGDAQPILDGLRALACELHDRAALGPGTEHALTLLETARHLLHGAFAQEPVPVTDQGKMIQGGLAGWQIHAITSHIDRNLDGKLCLATLAQVARLSPSYLCRACRQTWQCSPMQYVMQRRLLAAKQLLRHSPMPLSELALNCGFADQAHFSRMFRAATGETPLRWRRMWQSGAASAGAGAARQSGAQLVS